MRIASLLPSATDIAVDLGLTDELVGVTFECDLPVRDLERIEILVGGRDTRSMTPAEIDSYVRAQLDAGADLYTLHENALRRLDPDLILTQDLCRVCALSTDQVADALEHLGCKAQVVTLDPYSLDDVLASIARVADAAGVPERGFDLVAALRARLSRVAGLVADRPRQRVAVVEWIEPVYGAGHWIPDLIEAAGGTPVACSPRQRSAPTSWDAITACSPDVVVVAPCGFDLTGATEQALQVVPRLPDVPVWAVDADRLIVRPGPHLIDGVETLAAILHPAGLPASPSAVQVSG